jgi:hypothetical protein
MKKPPGKNRQRTSPAQMRLTEKEHALVEIMRQNPDISVMEAGKRAGYSESYSRTWLGPDKFGPDGKLREFFVAECERQGVGMEALVRVHREALDANVVLSVVPGKAGKPEDQPGNTGKAGTAGSSSVEFIEAPDHKTRLLAAKSIAKIIGLETQHIGVDVNITGQMETVERRKQAAMRIRAGVEVVIVSEDAEQS